jgi:hypothetical protein
MLDKFITYIVCLYKIVYQVEPVVCSKVYSMLDCDTVIYM